MKEDAVFSILKTYKCKKIIDEVFEAINEWQTIAHSVGIRERTISLIKKEFEDINVLQ